MIEFRVVVILGLMGRKQKKTFRGPGSVLSLDVHGGLTVGNTCKNVLSGTCNIFALCYNVFNQFSVVGYLEFPTFLLQQC